MHVLPVYEHMCSYIAYLLVSSVFFCRFALSSLMSLSNLRPRLQYSILTRILTFTILLVTVYWLEYKLLQSLGSVAASNYMGCNERLAATN